MIIQFLYTYKIVRSYGSQKHYVYIQQIRPLLSLWNMKVHNTLYCQQWVIYILLNCTECVGRCWPRISGNGRDQKSQMHCVKRCTGIKCVMDQKWQAPLQCNKYINTIWQSIPFWKYFTIWRVYICCVQWLLHLFIPHTHKEKGMVLLQYFILLGGNVVFDTSYTYITK